MVTPELNDYIKQQRQIGKSDEVIKNELLASKWLESDINQALLNTTFSTPNPPSLQSTNSPIKEKPKVIKIISTLLFIIACLYF